MRLDRRRKSVLAGAAAGLATVGAAVAFATGPGEPETREIGVSWEARLVEAKARFCQGEDGFYAEARLHHQATSDRTTSSDPRFDGLVDFFQHELVRIGGDNSFLGHVDGTAHWYESDTGRKTATTRFMAVIKEPGTEAPDGYDMMGTMGGPSGNTDGIAYPYGELPRGDVYATFFAFEGEDEGGGTFAGRFGAKDEAINPSSDTTGGIVQSFNCQGDYEPVFPESAPRSAGAERASGRPLGRLAAPRRIPQRSRGTAAVADAERLPWWLSEVVPGHESGPLDEVLGLMGD